MGISSKRLSDLKKIDAGPRRSPTPPSWDHLLLREKMPKQYSADPLLAATKLTSLEQTSQQVEPSAKPKKKKRKKRDSGGGEEVGEKLPSGKSTEVSSQVLKSRTSKGAEEEEREHTISPSANQYSAGEKSSSTAGFSPRDTKEKSKGTRNSSGSGDPYNQRLALDKSIQGLLH